MPTVILLAMSLLAVPGGAWAQASALSVDEHTLLLAHFDDGFDADFAKGSAEAEVAGAALVANGKWGGAVSLGEDRALSFDAEGNLDMAAGTLTFWLKPEWQTPTASSHAILSMGLDGDPPGYFALSQGWWEGSGGAGRMYFIYDNQAYMHTSSAAMMTLGERLNDWHHIALTWAEGSPGHCAIYVDGERVSRSTKDCGEVRRPRTRLSIGSDRATGMGELRPTNALLDELAIYDFAMDEEQVSAAFKSQESRWEELQSLKWAWLTDVLAGPAPVLPRDEQGRILESRAVLDEWCRWVDPEATDELVAKLKRAGFNVYIPCVWHGRGAYWPCELEPPAKEIAEKLTDPDPDPLAYLIEQCHANGIEVHPWITVCKRERDIHPEFVEEGTPDGMFDAHRPEFRDFIMGLMLDVIERYEVDGINLDYIRTGGLCRGPRCQAEYKARFGTELLEDVTRRGKDFGPNANIVRWQDDAISDIVRRVAEEGRAIRPGLIVSVDGHVRPPTSPPGTDGRNELPWVEPGWVDVVYNMDYGQHLSFAIVDAVRGAIDKPKAIVDLPGNYERTKGGKVIPRAGKLVADHIEYCRRRWPGNGVGLYCYSMLSEEQIEALRAGPFKEDAVPHWVR